VKLSRSQRKYRNQSHEFQASHLVSPKSLNPAARAGLIHDVTAADLSLLPLGTHMLGVIEYKQNEAISKQLRSGFRDISMSGYLHKVANGSIEHTVSKSTEVSMMSLL
jgi:hypothetical protein